MAFTLPPLPYAYDALEPAIDKETMTFHHDKHHQTYVDNLNKAVDADASLQGKSLEEIFTSISTAPKAVRNNGGGHWNHSLFWELLAPADQAGEPSAELAAAIDADLGGMDKFKEDFNAAGAAQFGSGWAWLIVQNGKLKITSTPNQDNPLMDVVDERGEVILGADVWEHAYYLKYQNRRADYLKVVLDGGELEQGQRTVRRRQVRPSRNRDMTTPAGTSGGRFRFSSFQRRRMRCG